MSQVNPPQWLVQIDEFADTLSERANNRIDILYTSDVEYMKKAARLLKIMTVAYNSLSNQINLFFEKEQILRSEAEEIVEIVANQMKVVEEWPGPKQQPPHIRREIEEE